jgi:acetyl esterase
MPLHPQAESLLAQVAALGEPPLEACSAAQAREIRARRLRAPTEPIHHTRDLDADGVPVRLYRPNDRDDLGLLIFFHGGGWVIGNLDSHDNVCRILANSSDQAVLSVDYRLSPEHQFPEPLEDAVTATRWAHAHAASLGCSSDRLAIGGDSAGANLAIVVGHLAPVPLSYQLLVYPATDLTCSSPSFVENATGPAARAGIQAGDVIVSVGSAKVSSPDELKRQVDKASGSIALLIERNGQKLFVPVRVG